MCNFFSAFSFATSFSFAVFFFSLSLVFRRLLALFSLALVFAACICFCAFSLARATASSGSLGFFFSSSGAPESSFSYFAFKLAACFLKRRSSRAICSTLTVWNLRVCAVVFPSVAGFAPSLAPPLLDPCSSWTSNTSTSIPVSSSARQQLSESRTPKSARAQTVRGLVRPMLVSNPSPACF